MRSCRGGYAVAVWVIALVMFSGVLSFAQTESIRGVEFRDGSVVYGKVLKITPETIDIEAADGTVITRPFNEVHAFIRDDELLAAQKQHHFFSVGTELSHIRYEEKDIMEEKGWMYGIVGSYAYRNGVMLKAEGKIAYGEVEYVGRTMGGTPLTISDIPNYHLEGRGLIGFDIEVKAFTITPYAGLGYRWLQDNTQKKYAGGYKRESNYFYLPLGVEATVRLGRGWFLGLTTEFDAFLWGKQKSYMSNAYAGYNDVENKQNKGYGLRASLPFGWKTTRVGFVVEPYVKYWNVEDSDMALLTDYGSYSGFMLYEPANESMEIGCRIAVTF